MQIIYEEDAFQVFEEYEKRYAKLNDIGDLKQLDFILHYCRKYGARKNLKNKTKLAKIYQKWRAIKGDSTCK